MIVTRFAPSPTGQMHIGNLNTALVDYMIAKTYGGKCLIRIEDTDQTREVEGVAVKLLNELKMFGITFDNDPIYQSTRGEIYKKYADELLKKNLAYHDDGAIRFRAPAKTEIRWDDLIKGDMRMPGLERDPVIMKSSGLPPYNLACAVDDELMGVTHIVRGEEWLSSTPEHIQLKSALGFKPVHYAHMPVICKIDEDGNKRKLSKRKDNEALVEHFLNAGYPTDAVIEYLLTIFNSDFEPWRLNNPNKSWREFEYRFEKIGSNSPLFDWDKLNSISGNIIAGMNIKDLEREIKNHFGDKLTLDQYKSVLVLLNIDRGTERPRKDITKYSDILTEFDYLFRPVKMSPLLEDYKKLLAPTKDEWFAAVKQHCEENSLKVRDFTQSIRVALTGREKSTDLYTISKILLGNL